jgi:hypothetical protein
MLTVGADNLLTHCPVVFGGGNHGNPDFFFDEGNLTWLRLQSRRCVAETERLAPALLALFRQVFGTGPGEPDAIDAILGPPIFRRTEP